MDREKLVKRNVFGLYAYSIARGFFFSIPVIVLFWQENGLSIAQVMLLQSLFALMVVVLEVPSGYLADMIGRSRVLIAAAIADTAGIILYSTGSSFPMFLGAEALFAVSVSLASGADSAFIHDSLKTVGRESSYAKVMGRNHFFQLLALGLANALGGFIGQHSLRFTLILSIPFFACAIPASLLLREPPAHGDTAPRKSFPSLRLIRETVFDNRDVRRYIVFSAVLFAFTNGALWLYQPYFALSSLPVWAFGLIFASFQLVAAFSARSTGRLLEKTGAVPLMAAMIGATSAAYLLMGLFILPVSFLFVYLQQWVRGTQHIIFTDAVNRQTDSSVRATVLSIQSLAGRLGYSAVIPFIGLAADRFSIPVTLSVTGLAAAAACTLAFLPIGLRRKAPSAS